MMIKCVDCKYKPFCLARLTDGTIRGCNLPLVWNGTISQADAMVWHAVKEDDRK